MGPVGKYLRLPHFPVDDPIVVCLCFAAMIVIKICIYTITLNAWYSFNVRWIGNICDICFAQKHLLCNARFCFKQQLVSSYIRELCAKRNTIDSLLRPWEQFAKHIWIAKPDHKRLGQRITHILVTLSGTRHATWVSLRKYVMRNCCAYSSRTKFRPGNFSATHWCTLETNTFSHNTCTVLN